MLKRSLGLQPQQQRARWVLGGCQRQEGRPAEAAETRQPLLPQVDAATAATLRVQIDAARQEAGLTPLPAAQAPAAAATANALTVKVSLDPDFASRVRLRGDASVFVIARIPDGPPMPVAAEKHSLQDLPLTITLAAGDRPMPTQTLSDLEESEVFARLSNTGEASVVAIARIPDGPPRPVAAEKHSLQDLPLTITLDDGDSPMPTQKLSDLEEVEVFARLSSSGEAMRQEGDLDSKPVRVALPATAPVELVIGAK